MIVEHLGQRPRIDETAYLAPNAVVCGDVTVGAHARVLFGAVVTAESGPVEIGAHNIVMEHAVLRGVARHRLRTGDHVLVGPHAHLTGCALGDNAFVATGASVFNAANIGDRCEVRINAVVHVASRLPNDTTVPIGWVAVGDPAQILPPDCHEEIWQIQEQTDFPGRVFGVDRAEPGQTAMPEITTRYARALARYRSATILERTRQPRPTRARPRR